MSNRMAHIERQNICQMKLQNNCQIMPHRMPKYTSDRPSDKMSEYIPNRLPENMSDRTSEYIISDRLAEYAQYISKDLS